MIGIDINTFEAICAFLLAFFGQIVWKNDVSIPMLINAFIIEILFYIK